MEPFYAVIMAGGGGTRLWPLSRLDRPKQSLKVVGERTMFQIAVERLAPLFPPERILVVTNATYAPGLRAQCPALLSDNFIIEPGPRGTAPAVGLAALRVKRRAADGVMACLTADHFIGDEARFRDLLSAAAQTAGQRHLVTLGIAPTFASTGFGYIQRGQALGHSGDFEIYRAARFKEKPAQAEADAMLADGQHSWNSGMFVWRVSDFLAEVERQLPALHQVLQAVEARPASLAERWQDAPSTTLDYGIMEGARDVAVIPATGLLWSDIGSWDALFEVLDSDGDGNLVVGGDHAGIGTTNTLVHSSGQHKRLVATIGVENLVIVETDDVLLVCRRERSQEVREMVEQLKKQGDKTKYL